MRAATMAGWVLVAFVVETTLLRPLSGSIVRPDLVLLVVVLGSLGRGVVFGAVTGFAAGVLMDLAPPADHALGRWALALLVAGALAGLVRRGLRRPAIQASGVAVGCSLIAVVVYLLTGLSLDRGALLPDDILAAVVAGALVNGGVALGVVALVGIARRHERAADTPVGVRV